MTSLDSTESTAPPNSESAARLRCLVLQATPNLATLMAPGSLRFKFSTADCSWISTSGSPHPLTPAPHQRSTSCWPHSGPLGPTIRLHPVPPYSDLTSASPCLLCSLLLPAPTPPTSNRSTCPSHQPLDHLLWLPRFLVFLPQPSRSPAPKLLNAPLFPLLSHLFLCLASSLLPAARLLQTPIQTRLSTRLLPQHPGSSATYLLASQVPRTATSLLTFLGGPGSPWSQKQRETEWHQANEQAQRMWAGAGLHGPQTKLSVRRRLQPREPQHC